MKRWNIDSSQEEVFPKVDAFIDAVIAVSKLHGYTIGHEDGYGSFVITKYEEDNSDWLRGAACQGVTKP